MKSVGLPCEKCYLQESPHSKALLNYISELQMTSTVLHTNISIVLVSSLITTLMFTASNSANFCTHLTANMLHYPKGRCHTAVDDGGAWGQSIKTVLQVFWIFVMQHHPCQPDHPLQHVIVDKGSTVKKPAADAEILKNNKHTVQEVT